MKVLVVVQRGLVPDEKLTGATTPVFLLNRIIKYLAEVEVYVNTPYLISVLVAKCMDNPINNLVLGNIEGVRRPDNPDKGWNKRMALEGRDVREPDIGRKHDRTLKHAQGSLTNDNEVAVLAEKETVNDLPGSSLPVPIIGAAQVDRAGLISERTHDVSLKRCFDPVGKRFISWCSDVSEFIVSGGFLFRRHRMPTQTIKAISCILSVPSNGCTDR